LAKYLDYTQNLLTGGSIAARMSQPRSKSSEPQAVPPVMNCKIRSKDGPWLWRCSVSKKGLPFQVTDWQSVVARPNQYVFTFEFTDVENSAWIAPYRLAQFLRQNALGT
jgi:hypothetical protein